MKTYAVTGMTCGGCERSVVAAVTRKVPGVTVAASHTSGEVRVQGEHAPGAVEAAVTAAGFGFGGEK